MAVQTKTRESGLGLVKQTLNKLGVAEEVRGKVIAVFTASSSVWWVVDADYIEYLVRQLVTLFSYKFDDERMAIPPSMVYLMSADKGVPSILLHWRVYLSLYQPYIKGWRLETIKDSEGRPIGMVAIIIDKDGNEWRWERYYDNLQLVSRWKNKELMFAKTILKEALAIMFPHLNLLPPLSTVETYDPDDIDSQPPVSPMASATPPRPAQPPAAPSQAAQVTQGAEVSPSVQRSSTDIVRGLASTPPPAERRDKSQDGDLTREAKDRFKELAEVLGPDEALRRVNEMVKELGAERFNDLTAEKKRFVIMNIESIVLAEKKTRSENGAGS